MGSRIFGHRFLALALLGAATVTGCVDPGKRFDDFDRRVLDAGQGGDDLCAGELTDVSGDFLIALSPGFSPDNLLQFLATVEMTTDGGGGTANFSFQPLTAIKCDEANYREPVGDPLVANDVEVDGAGVFSLTFSNAQVDGLANQVSCGSILADITLDGVIRGADEWCGDGSGMVKVPIAANLEGSTFGAIRVEPGTAPADLPDPQPACSPCDTPDAG